MRYSGKGRIGPSDGSATSTHDRLYGAGRAKLQAPRPATHWREGSSSPFPCTRGEGMTEDRGAPLDVMARPCFRARESAGARPLHAGHLSRAHPLAFKRRGERAKLQALPPAAAAERKGPHPGAVSLSEVLCLPSKAAPDLLCGFGKTRKSPGLRSRRIGHVRMINPAYRA